MKKKFSIKLVCMILIFSMFSVTAFACSSCISDSQWYPSAAVITGDYVNLRACHNTQASSGGQVFGGDLCNTSYIYPKTNRTSSNTWYRVSMYSGQCEGLSGWVFGAYVGTEY